MYSFFSALLNLFLQRWVALAPFQEPTDEGIAALSGALLVVFCLLFLAGLGLFIWSCVFIYNDAKARGENAIVWLILNIFFFPLPWLIWLLVRPKQKLAQTQFGGLPPPPPGYPGASPPYGYPPPPQPTPGPYAPPAPYPSPAPAPTVPSAPPPAGPSQNVRCPNCQTVFGYQKNPYGPTRLKCPSCGTEGTL